MQRALIVILLVLCPVIVSAKTVLVLGDSLSAAYNMKLEAGWVHLLSERLGPNHQVINASISGDTTAGGVNRLPAALKKHRPDIVILELGANDGLRGLKPQLLADNLGAMIDAAHEAGARVLLVGMRMPPNYGPAYTRRFAEVFADVAEAKKVPLVPFLLDGFADRPELFLPDGIHPTAEAQPRIVDTV